MTSFLNHKITYSINTFLDFIRSLPKRLQVPHRSSVWINFSGEARFLFILLGSKAVLNSLIFIMTILVDSLNLLRLIPLMGKLQWLMNNTFYLLTAALPKCFKMGKNVNTSGFIIPPTIIATNVCLSH